jgi:polyhydroxyalkanoate synthase subunit PhaC
MAGPKTDKAQPQAGGSGPGPDVMLGLWTSWMDQMSNSTQASAGQAKPWWQTTTDAPAADVLVGGVKQLEESLSKSLFEWACLADPYLIPQ